MGLYQENVLEEEEYRVTRKTLLPKTEVALNSRVHIQLKKWENLYVLLLNKQHDCTDLEDKYQF